MRRIFVVLSVFFTAILPYSAHADDDYRHATPSFLSEYSAIDGSRPFYIALKLDIDKGWHTYWKNPGDSGLETAVEWNNLPEGVAVSEMIWLPPTRETMPPLTNYGYADVAYHLFRVTPPATIPENGLQIEGSASWLVCKETCIPERADISLTIASASENVPTSERAELLLASDAARLPLLNATVTEHAKDTMTVRFAFPDGTQTNTFTDAYFFPETGALIEHATPQPRIAGPASLTITMRRGYSDIPPVLKGILEVNRADGSVFHYRAGPQPAGLVDNGTPRDASILLNDLTLANKSKTASSKETTRALPLLLLFAFLGGIILNAMPCVFPVLSLKAIAVSKKAGESANALRLNGIGYTAGILTGFAIAAVALISLKTAGRSIGWGFQMQSPLFVSAMALLLFIVGLNLAGYIELRRAFGGNSARADKEGIQGAYFTGLLAAAVATPCTAPFMATALGAALTLPALSGGAIFMALGLGLAFPYLLITFIPGCSRLLPKPGAWMEHLRHTLAYPMFFSVIWLIWVLMQQVDIHSVTFIMIAMVSCAALLRLIQSPSRLKKPLTLICALILFAGVIAPFYHIRNSASQALPSHGANNNSSRKSIADISISYNAADLESMVANDKKVFVYATAAWCITCKVNERVALNHEDVKQAFADNNVSIMRADWTNEDKHITAFLETFGRNGVPLYVYYAGKDAQPVVLPQLLTPSIMLGFIGTTLDSGAR